AADLELPNDASFRLELDTWGGAVRPRLVLGHARPCAEGAVAVIGEPGDGAYLAAALAEVDRGLGPGGVADDGRRPAGVAARPDAPSGRRHVIDRRHESPLSVLADACAAGPTLAVCADVGRRRAGLAARAGGFTLVCAEALAAEPGLAAPFAQLVVLDPPSRRPLLDAACGGEGFTHLAWGEPERRFAEQVHESEYALRASLVALYRALRLQRRAEGDELVRLLRGDGPHGRSARHAGRLVRVLSELGLISVERTADAFLVELVGRADPAGRAELESSPAYRAYDRWYEDGRRFLSRATAQVA